MDPGKRIPQPSEAEETLLEPQLGFGIIGLKAKKRWRAAASRVRRPTPALARLNTTLTPQASASRQSLLPSSRAKAPPLSAGRRSGAPGLQRPGLEFACRAMKGWLVLLTLLLACLPKAESPAFRPSCDDGEYPYSGICCLRCPAGKVKVKSCTVKNNTICQCKNGYYCPPVCEECIRCTEKCPEGQIIVQECNATTDMKCGTPPGEAMDPTTKYIIIGVVIFVVSVCFLLLYLCLRRCNVSERSEDVKDALISISKETLSPKADDATSENQKVRSGLGDPPSHLGSEFPELAERCRFLVSNANDLCEDPRSGITPSAPPLPPPDGPSNGMESNTKCPEVIVKNPSHRELNILYYDLRNNVPQGHWKMLVRRMGLSDNDIDKIIRDNPYNADEQDYQMLKTLQDRFGIEKALCTSLYSLWDMKLMHIYENLRNELINNDIITLKPN
ncbi:hypothetical protein lerEdw1_005295 [Lerista edwardsae]|nr:hypothetical protein lerEdw1_005295 [Lerista edwardsae]